jgi:hypothetical protein
MGMGVDGDGADEVGNDEEQDLRATLSDAYDSLEDGASGGDEPPDAPEPEAEAKEVTPEATEEQGPAKEPEGRDDKGRFKSPRRLQATKATSIKSVVAPNSTPAPPETLRAPQAWKPATREKWAALPPEVQQEVIRRERETTATLAESAEARKSWDSFRQAVAPYEGQIRAEGSDPVRAAASLFQTAQALRTAPPQHKAQLVASMVRTFGVPIDALDAALAGQAPPQQSQQAFDPNALSQQVTNQVLQQLQQHRAQAAAKEVAEEIETFSQTHEFFEDVREDMADLLDMASKRGVRLTPEDAYKKAIALHPDVSEAVQQKEAAKRAENARASTQKARAAASSIKSQPSGISHTKEPVSIRDYLEDNWESLSGR